MEELQIKSKTGAVRVTITDEFDEPIGSFKFLPTDVEIAKRWDETMNMITAIKVSENTDYGDALAVERKLKEETNHLLNYEVAENIYSICSPLTVNQDGDFFYEVVLNGIADVIEQVFKTRVEKKRAKINKALAKYKK